MNTGQILLTLGAMLILSLTTLRVNSHFVSSGASLDETKFAVLAVSLASSILEEANSKAFDENTLENAATDTLELTRSLGKENGEYIPYDFDDCDDYNNYNTVIDSIPSAVFDVSCKVNYIFPTTPDINRSIRTWHKKITVTISSHSMSDTIKMSSIFSYWYYR